MRRRFPIALALLFLASAAFAQAAVPAAPPHIGRLVHVSKLWGTVRYLHPYLAYKEIDWDAALVAAIPRVREAKTVEEYRAAVQSMLDALGDPVTRVAEPPPPPFPKPAPGQQAPLSRQLDGGVLLVDLAKYLRTVSPNDAFVAMETLPVEIGKSSAVVVDLRAGDLDGTEGFYAGIFLQEIGNALVSRPSRAPSQRYLLHSGFQPQTGGSSGGYYSGFVTQHATLFEPLPGATPRKVVFLLDRRSEVHPLVLALQAAGDARIVAEGRLDEDSLVVRRTLDLGAGLKARVRVSEVVPFPGWRGVRANIEVPEGDEHPAQPADPALDTAVAEARKEWPRVETAASFQSLPDPVFRPDRTYADMKEPGVEHRQLAVIRAWNAIHWFYPYLHLIGDWDAVLPEFLARMEGTKTFRDYALTLTEMMTHVPDGHTALWGHPDVEQPFGDTWPPVRVRWVEGAPVAVRVSEEVRRAGIEVGDAILEVDGEAVEARIERLSRYATASTRPALLNRIAGRLLLVGPAGSTAKLKVQKLDGSVREVSLVRDPKNTLPPQDKGDVVRILPGNLGYVDLTRLTRAEVDGMFDKLKETRGIIFDMRGYPQGTAWAIAPRINTRNAKNGAQFRRSQVAAFSEEEGESGFYFSQPLPRLPEGETKYTGPTVMLIDDRAISQSEHSGLFYEAANDTKFIGTATAGANGDVTRFPVPGGIWIGFTGHDVRHADGRQLQRVGLVPDIEVAPTRAGLKAGKDEVLERAVAYLEEVLE
ncbi:MAG TPA: S41 family peptidase [Thermoanaerobaculia bacterium]|nr:S41 family peptidase [Thermoanaerobaculia bacterium]